MKFSRVHYRFMAEQFHELLDNAADEREAHAIRKTILHFATALKANNGAFKREVFLTVCGINN